MIFNFSFQPDKGWECSNFMWYHLFKLPFNFPCTFTDGDSCVFTTEHDYYDLFFIMFIKQTRISNQYFSLWGIGSYFDPKTARPYPLRTPRCSAARILLPALPPSLYTVRTSDAARLCVILQWVYARIRGVTCLLPHPEWPSPLPPRGKLCPGIYRGPPPTPSA